MFGATSDHAAADAASGRAEKGTADAAAEKRTGRTTGNGANGDSLMPGIALVAAALRVAPTVIIVAGVGDRRGERGSGDGECEKKAHSLQSSVVNS
jgi:hypothetical protein